MRRTKMVCTIGPACCSLEGLESLARQGMNVARLNMCHGTHEWHTDIINKIRQLNKEKGWAGRERSGGGDYILHITHQMRQLKHTTVKGWAGWAEVDQGGVG